MDPLLYETSASSTIRIYASLTVSSDTHCQQHHQTTQSCTTYTIHGTRNFAESVAQSNHATHAASQPGHRGLHQLSKRVARCVSKHGPHPAEPICSSEEMSGGNCFRQIERCDQFAFCRVRRASLGDVFHSVAQILLEYGFQLAARWWLIETRTKCFIDAFRGFIQPKRTRFKMPRSSQESCVCLSYSEEQERAMIGRCQPVRADRSLVRVRIVTGGPAHKAGVSSLLHPKNTLSDMLRG